VTGVQSCALPILSIVIWFAFWWGARGVFGLEVGFLGCYFDAVAFEQGCGDAVAGFEFFCEGAVKNLACSTRGTFLDKDSFGGADCLDNCQRLLCALKELFGYVFAFDGDYFGFAVQNVSAVPADYF
jgi:hypothetical protein